MSFKIWLEASEIKINIEPFSKLIAGAIQDIVAYQMSRSHKLKSFQLDRNFLNQALEGYPLKDYLLNAIGKPNFERILNAFAKWYLKLPYNTPNGMELRQAYRHLIDYSDSVSQNLISSDTEVKQWEKQVLDETMVNMFKLKQILEAAVGRIPNFQSSIVINPLESTEYGRVTVDAANSAYVCLGGHACFTLFVDENFNIEDIGDILEDEEEDDFISPVMKSDYYSLIKELKNPGSSQKGKVLTLFTARPVEDRNFYTSTKILPAGVFLTNSFSHADGLAGELSSTRRDIWKVRINSRYLIQTLDGPVKYYQVTTDAPVESISLY